MNQPEYLLVAKDGVLRWCPTCNVQRTIFIILDNDGSKLQFCCAHCQRIHRSFEVKK